jgi:hypothetical protein
VTARDLGTNPEVAVHLESGDQVVILEGEARRTSDRQFLARFGELYGAKYDWPVSPDDVDPENPDAAFFVVWPRRAVSWSSATEIGETITRWTFLDPSLRGDAPAVEDGASQTEVQPSVPTRPKGRPR